MNRWISSGHYISSLSPPVPVVTVSLSTLTLSSTMVHEKVTYYKMLTLECRAELAAEVRAVEA